jgi:hypothetical protein
VKLRITLSTSYSYSTAGASTTFKELSADGWDVNEKGDLSLYKTTPVRQTPIYRVQAGHWYTIERLDI